MAVFDSFERRAKVQDEVHCFGSPLKRRSSFVILADESLVGGGMSVSLLLSLHKQLLQLLQLKRKCFGLILTGLLISC